MASFKVTGKLSLDGSNFQAGINRAQAAVKGLGGSALSSLKGQLAAAFSVGAVTMLAKKTLEYADSIDETASRIGVGAEQLQEWSYAAKQAGSDTEELAGFIEKLTMAALDPDKQKLFAQMGISPQGMTSAGLFQGVSQWSQGKSSSEVTPILRELTGMKGVGKLLNTLQTDLDAAGKQARAVGAVMGEKLVKQLGLINDQFSIIGQILVTQFGPALLTLSKFILSMSSGALNMNKTFDKARESNPEYAGFGGGFKFWADMLRANVIQGRVDRGGSDVYPEERSWLEKFKSSMAGAYDTSGAAAADTMFDAFLKRLSELANAKGFTPSIIGAPLDSKKDAIRGGLPDASPEMRIGNFLGSSGSQLQTISQQQLQVQRRIEAHTSESATYSRELSNSVSRLLGG